MDKKLPYASDFRHLLAYKLALQMAKDIYEESKSFPREELFSLTDQIRRSSRSVGAQIAEAWGKRQYVKHFKSKLTDALAELYETEHWLEIAITCKYIPEETQNIFLEMCSRIRNLIYGMIRKAKYFCREYNS